MDNSFRNNNTILLSLSKTCVIYAKDYIRLCKTKVRQGTLSVR